VHAYDTKVYAASQGDQAETKRVNRDEEIQARSKEAGEVEPEPLVAA
jgi:hypothetical protein